MRVVGIVFSLMFMFGVHPEAHGITQTDVAAGVSLVVNVWGWVMRYRKGDVTLGGMRK